MSKNDGGPAYPWTEYEQTAERGTAPPIYFQNGGMTVRQAYKIAALQGILSGNYCGPEYAHEPMKGVHQVKPAWTMGEIAQWAGAMADAMLAEDAEFEGSKL